MEYFVLKRAFDERKLKLDNACYAETDELYQCALGHPEKEGLYATPDEDSGTVFTDRLDSATSQLILSSRAVETINEFKLCPTVKEYPLEIRSPPSTPPSSYFIKSASQKHRILDPEQSDLLSFAGVVVRIKMWAVSRTHLPDFDFFLADLNSWIASEVVVNAIERRHLTGFHFEQLRIYD